MRFRPLFKAVLCVVQKRKMHDNMDIQRLYKRVTDMRNNTFIRKLSFLLFLPLGILLAHGASLYPEAVEKLYASGLYRGIGPLLSSVTGFIPFSVAELLIVFIPLLLVIYLSVTLYRFFRRPKGKSAPILNFLANLLAAASLAYFLFVVLWGLNYCRLPFSKLAGLDAAPASLDELEAVSISLIHRANGLRSQVHEGGDGVMAIAESPRAIFSRADKGYKAAALILPQLGGRYGAPKGVLLSIGMTYAGIGGIYFPYTGEANVNIMVPDAMLPSTACHEMAHQRGFAREDEANYISYWTCNLHPDKDFQYSGTLLALIHATNALHDYAPERYEKIRDLYSEAVLRDLQAVNEFWRRYEGPVERTSNRLNNAYLKANRQKDGVQSYGRMVDLLIGEYRKNHKSE